MRWTEEQLADYRAKREQIDRALAARGPAVIDTSNRPFALPNNEAGAFALGRLPTGVMNKSEAKYAEHLAQLQHAKQILWWKFEGIKLRLADNTFYTPDFNVMTADCRIELHECKGFWRDDARAKIKIAAAMYPFRFVAVTARAKKHGGGWDTEEF